MDFIFNDIDKLITPIGSITVTHEGAPITFSVKKNSFNIPYEIYGDDRHTVTDTLQTETNYNIVIPTVALEIGKIYEIRFDGEALEIGGGDEHTLSLTATFGGYSIGIGAYDPNDNEKLDQAYQHTQEKGYKHGIHMPSEFDQSKFINYALDVLDDMTGYSFKLIDRSAEYIYFTAAWICNGYLDVLYYENALDFWIS